MLSLLVKLWSSRFLVCWALAWTRLVNSLDLCLTLIPWLERLRKSRLPSSSRWRRYINSFQSLFGNCILKFCYLLGVVPVRCCWSRRYVQRRFGPEHSLVNQLLGFSAQETLAERAIHQHQDFDGQSSALVLNYFVLYNDRDINKNTS